MIRYDIINIPEARNYLNECSINVKDAIYKLDFNVCQMLSWRTKNNFIPSISPIQSQMGYHCV